MYFKVIIMLILLIAQLSLLAFQIKHKQHKLMPIIVFLGAMLGVLGFILINIK